MMGVHNFAFDSPSSRIVTLSRNYNYNVYSFISDEDVRNLLAAHIYLRESILHDFYARMNTKDFSQVAFNNEFNSLCAPDILAVATNYAKQNPDNALGGWQIFKPMPGLNAIKAENDITYEGNDWFSITPKGDDTKVRLKVVMTPYKMRPVIVAVDNPAFGISATKQAESKLAKGYKNMKKFIYSPAYTFPRSKSYFATLSQKISRISDAAQRGVVTEGDFSLFLNQTIKEREQMLTAFLNELSVKDINKHRLSRKYDNWLHADVNKAIISAQENKSDKWNAFNTGSNTPNIVYEGNNWFRLSSDSDKAKDIQVQMILNKDGRTPIITGLVNPDAGIALGTDFSLNIYLSRASR
ncbi:MAG: hypothetical protein J1F13_00500 [Prevotellaceae bacterium]|nr:hypothetical protein [Prevotellaceae bacterium]